MHRDSDLRSFKKKVGMSAAPGYSGHMFENTTGIACMVVNGANEIKPYSRRCAVHLAQGLSFRRPGPRVVLIFPIILHAITAGPPRLQFLNCLPNEFHAIPNPRLHAGPLTSEFIFPTVVFTKDKSCMSNH